MKAIILTFLIILSFTLTTCLFACDTTLTEQEQKELDNMLEEMDKDIEKEQKEKKEPTLAETYMKIGDPEYRDLWGAARTAGGRATGRVAVRLDAAPDLHGDASAHGDGDRHAHRARSTDGDPRAASDAARARRPGGRDPGGHRDLVWHHVVHPAPAESPA